MALDDNGFVYVRSPAGIFKIVTIICSLCAFICAVVLGNPWSAEIVSFFNIMQLIILIYGIAVLVLRVTDLLKISWWKWDCIMSMILACLEFAATSLWALGASGQKASWTAMVVFGYVTGIICLLNAAYITLKV